MRNRKWLTAILSVIFVVMTGIIYSCGRAREQNAQIFLNDQKTNPIQSDIQVNTEEVPSGEAGQESLTRDDKEISQAGAGQDDSACIYIHICGAVKNPDVYEVEEGSRLIDVIELAGGLTEEAAGDYVNQAAAVEDGQRIYIPMEKETENIPPDDYRANTDMDGESEKININTASAKELMTLTGIGEAKAKSIITYREDNGGFQSIEEIKNIEGIKDAVFHKISDRITVK